MLPIRAGHPLGRGHRLTPDHGPRGLLPEQRHRPAAALCHPIGRLFAQLGRRVLQGRAGSGQCVCGRRMHGRPIECPLPLWPALGRGLLGRCLLRYVGVRSVYRLSVGAREGTGGVLLGGLSAGTRRICSFSSSHFGYLGNKLR